jgi:hypothetical protein
LTGRRRWIEEEKNKEESYLELSTPATMPQKSARGGGKAPANGKKGQGGGKKAEDDREETLQAVVCVLICVGKGEMLS